MTPLRQRETLQAELAGLKGLLQSTPEDPLATPMMKERIAELEEALKGLDQKYPTAPETELFFMEGPAIGSDGLEITFTSAVLESYQNMVTNHYAAKHYGTLRYSGRRRGETETKLFLTALPRGSFGLQLSQTHVSDFITAGNVSAAMQDISSLIDATVSGDDAFESVLGKFNPRVLQPLTRFIEALHNGGGACRVVTGFNETVLSVTKIEEAHSRVSSAKTDEQVVTMPGMFGGVLMFSWEFEFQPNEAETIHGALDEEVTEQAATAMSHDFTSKPAIAKMRMTVVHTRSGRKKPTYELIGLESPQETQAPGPKE